MSTGTVDWKKMISLISLIFLNLDFWDLRIGWMVIGIMFIKSFFPSAEKFRAKAGKTMEGSAVAGA